MNKTINIGIIGCGNIANKKHMPALTRLANVKLTAFCDIIEERAVAALEKFGASDAKHYTDYRALLADNSIDVIHVCTPNSSHAEISISALNHGKHVMCEKPMAKNSAEAEAMLLAARRSGKKLTIGYQLRFQNESLYLKNQSMLGRFGEIYYARATALRRRRVPNWGVFFDEALQGGGSLIDIGTHALDLTLWVMNNYKPKYCVGTVYHKLNGDTEQDNFYGPWDTEKFRVEDSAFGFVVMENGATIMLESSWALNTLDVREGVTAVCGTRAGGDMVNGVRINGIRDGKQYVDEISKNELLPTLISGGEDENTAEREARLWIEAIRNDTEVFTKPEEALVVTKILEGIYTSAKTGKMYVFD